MFDFDREIDRLAAPRSLKWDKYKGQGCAAHVGRRHRLLSPRHSRGAHETGRSRHLRLFPPSPRLINSSDPHAAALWLDHPDRVVVFLPGVVPGLESRLPGLEPARPWHRTPKPVYYPFLRAPGFNDRPLLTVPMVEEAGRWVLDLEELERQAPSADLLLLCNPTTRAAPCFTRELLAIDAIAERHNLVICSDGSTATCCWTGRPPHPHGALGPAAAERSAVADGAEQTFNIAGLCCSLRRGTQRPPAPRLQQACAASAPTSTCWVSWRPGGLRGANNGSPSKSSTI